MILETAEVTISIPIRGDWWIEIRRIPWDLSIQESEKIAAVIRALANKSPERQS